MARVVLFFSYKGGVGRSLTMCNVAVALSRSGKKVGLIDMDVDAPSLHLYFQKNIPSKTVLDDNFTDILSLLRFEALDLTPTHVEKATIELGLPKALGKIYLLPCLGREDDLTALDSEWGEKPLVFEKIYKMLADSYGLDFIFIDSRTGYSQVAILTAMSVPEVCMVTRADFVSQVGMKNMIDIFKETGKTIYVTLNGLPFGINADAKEVQDYLQAIGCDSSLPAPYLIPYNPEWYFGDGVLWDNADQHAKLFDKIASELDR